MKKLGLVILVFIINTLCSLAQNAFIKPAKVDYDAYEKLVAEVKEHRKDRLLDLNSFLKTSKEKNVIMLDTRSDAMYESKHVKGALHLNFSDFSQANLDRLLVNKDTKILIYCNNNFDDDQINFVSKIAIFPPPSTKKLTLALNIPTYINLYGYGYKNVYELSELVSVFDSRINFEGTSVPK